MIFIYGNDERQRYLGNLFEAAGYSVTRVPEPEMQKIQREGEISDADVHAEQEVLIFPVPAPPHLYHMLLPFVHSNMVILGGNIPDEVYLAGKRYNTKIFDYMKSPAVAVKNAVATAEGAICEAMSMSPVTIAGSRCLVIGYGKCGSVLCQKLLALQAEVSVIETDRVRLASAIAAGCQMPKDASFVCDYIFNTVPAPVLDQAFLEKVPPACAIVDIATKPGGTDFDFCHTHGICAKLTSGLPAKYAPQTAASIIFEEIIREVAL